MKIEYIYLLIIICGFFIGSIMFSQIIPKVILKKDIYSISNDKNPGAFNVFKHCGVKIGILCLFLDMLKGFIPLIISSLLLDYNNFLFILVMISPVFGHALGIFNRGKGGKCIATSFGVLIGILPISLIGFLLAGLYIFFSIVVKIKNMSIRSLITYSLFGICSFIISLVNELPTIAWGCLIISFISIIKHLYSLIFIERGLSIKHGKK